ncbi:MAG: DoxX family protein [Candidatus Dormibacteraeota bacterium]|nr:DoxX family protein [Candidatus Dormibacteraeota bacterium]
MTIWVLGALLAFGFLVLGLAKVLAVPAVRERSAHLGFSVRAYRGIGLLELLGAAGVLLGLAVPAIGLLAAAGLLVLLAGALSAHARHRDPLNTAAPALVFGAVDAAYLGLTVALLH